MLPSCTGVRSWLEARCKPASPLAIACDSLQPACASLYLLPGAGGSAACKAAQASARPRTCGEGKPLLPLGGCCRAPDVCTVAYIGVCCSCMALPASIKPAAFATFTGGGGSGPG